MKYLTYLLWLLLSLFILNGCTPVQVQPEPTKVTEKTKKAWEQRQQALGNESFQHWLLNGRASVTYRDENWPFGLQWKQYTAQAYDLKIYHPLTRNRLGKLTKQAKIVSFMDNKGKIYGDSSAERLLQKQLAIKIPIDGMQYWVRGITAPQYPVESYQLDHIGRPISLQQAGWTVRYADYKGRGYDALPQRVDIVRTKPEPIRVKMRIKQWGE